MLNLGSFLQSLHPLSRRPGPSTNSRHPRGQGRDWFLSEAAIYYVPSRHISLPIGPRGVCFLFAPTPSCSYLHINDVVVSLWKNIMKLKQWSWRARWRSSKLIPPSVYFTTKNVCVGGARHINQTAYYSEGVDSPAAVHPGCPPLAPCCCTCPFQGSLICLMH